MSAWADRMEARLKGLEEAVRGLVQPARTGIGVRDEDAVQKQAERAARHLVVVPLNIFDNAGAGTAAAALRAPADAVYIVGSASSGLSAERVVTNTGTVEWDLSTAAQAKAQIPTTATLNVTAYQVGGTQVVGAQGALVPDATDLATAITSLNALLARCRTHGLIAT